MPLLWRQFYRPGDKLSTLRRAPPDAFIPNTTGPGWWKANAPGLGTFEFKVNNDQSAITEFVFHIPNITCPGISYSTSSSAVQETPPWAVQNGQFDADVDIGDDPAIDVEISGAIMSASQQASGSWVFDGTCQGSWTGVPSQEPADIQTDQAE